VTVAVVATLAGLAFWWLLHGQRFPVLASILTLILSLILGGAGIAFWADRFRIPVMFVTLVGLILLSSGVSRLGKGDHVYQTVAATAAPPQPATIIQKYMDRYPTKDPMIVVTATGGGIHSTAWTTRVLDGLEEAFGRKGFHEHVVLMSSASGGSVATHYWAQLYLDHASSGSSAASDPRFPPQVKVAECSSLEAVAWGLLYPDLNHVLVWKDLVSGLGIYDRGWALETAFERNKEENCNWPKGGPKPRPPYQLGPLSEAAVQGRVPAFSFNSTFAENGARFLLSNYTVPDFTSPPCAFDSEAAVSACPSPPQPAPAFLTYYKEKDSDLSLFTAARLSATFPYVSPVAAALQRDGHVAREHLADGGYYDNDGMATAMEFLWSALGDSGSKITRDNGARIILIEIRNSPEPRTTPAPQKPPLLGHVIQQVGAPVSTLLGAWGIAQNLRNQQEWRVLESALQTRVQQHLVFAYKTEAGETDPLSWHLTALDKKRIEDKWKPFGSSAVELASCFPEPYPCPSATEEVKTSRVGQGH